MAILIEPLLTPAARRHIRKMLRAVRPLAGRLERDLRARLAAESAAAEAYLTPGERGRHARPAGATIAQFLAAITPAEASRRASVRAFLQHVSVSGRLLARLNLPPEEADAALDSFDELLGVELDGRFQPAREQLRLATSMALDHAYYEVREAEAQTFFGLYHAETEATGIEDLLRRFARVLAKALGARVGRVILFEPSRGPKSGPTGRRLSGRGLLSFPIGPGAVVQFGFSTPRRWLPRELALLEAAAARYRAAAERVRLEAEVRRLDAAARQAEEDERRRIGRELHDEAGQSLLFLRLQLELMEREAGAALAARLRGAREVSERTVAELRRIVAALSPSVLERMGLHAALRRLGDRFRKMHPADLRLVAPATAGRLPRPMEEVIYRVAQECLQNIAKHSQATLVKLSLRTSDQKVRLRVVDNGAGFSADSVKNKPMSFGLAGMRERAALMGGALAIRSAPGQGVAVTLELPRSHG